MSVQAAICRVMKVRKELSHRDLVVQVKRREEKRRTGYFWKVVGRCCRAHRVVAFSCCLLAGSGPGSLGAPSTRLSTKGHVGISARRWLLLFFLLPEKRSSLVALHSSTILGIDLFFVVLPLSLTPFVFFDVIDTQVQEQLRHLFDVDPPFVKRNIEDLINKDYLHRLEGREPGKEGYKYVA